MYKIVRVYKDRGAKRVIKKNLTLQEAQEHCRDPETFSATCKKRHNVRRTAMYGAWVDGYQEQ